MSEANDSTKRRAPTPMMNEETVPFWDATADGKLLLKRCNDCTEFHWYPRSKCPFCHSGNTSWVESAGTGVVYSFSVMRRAQPPYAFVYVTLDEGVTVISNLVDCDFDAIAIGQRVKVKFEDTGEGCAVPYFTTA
jgi:uncharacterized protein